MADTDTSVGFMSYRDVLRREISLLIDSVRISKDAEANYRQRNGLADEDYVRPGLAVEIPLLWGTF